MEITGAKFYCYLCNVKQPLHAALELSECYPSNKVIKVQVCYSCFRMVQEREPFLIKKGEGRYVVLKIKEPISGI